ncbi:energy-coupling factor transporter transmembrane component T [Anaerovorax sp. IOR16]|uniref:energy-coupling factor transporter transmembrane component T n=1 Tax=Anaerovorax sp. IOR16 TaxID=2773458 RepID=UPI0019D17F60|nr:energy-coupling factor transporter transmembrane component T [Anaerovorax sp. IOR16]
MKLFATYHPSVLLVYFIGVIGITMFTMNPLLLLISFLGAFGFAIQLENKQIVFASFAFYIPMFFLISVTNPLFSHNGVTPLFFLNDQPVTLEAMLYGAAIGGMIVSVMYWCRCYNLIMTSDKFIYLFGKVIPKLSLVISMAIRFVPLFIKQIKHISTVQKTMGIYATKSIVDRVLSGFRIFSAMITWSLENAVDTAASMRARGYGLSGRTNFSLFRFTLRDGIMLSVILALLITALIGNNMGVLDYSFYPRMSRIQISPLAIITYITLLTLLFIPFVVEVEENRKWNYYISKI